MTTLVEGTAALPTDSNGRRFLGLWVPSLSQFLAKRGTTDGHEIVQVEKGTPVSSRVAIGATTTLLLAANATRRKATFLNLDTSGTTVYLKPAATAATTDYPLPFGCEYTDDTGQTVWNAISSTGTVNINVCEYS